MKKIGFFQLEENNLDFIKGVMEVKERNQIVREQKEKN